MVLQSSSYEDNAGSRGLGHGAGKAYIAIPSAHVDKHLLRGGNHLGVVEVQLSVL